MRIRQTVRGIFVANATSQPEVLLMEMDFPWHNGTQWILPGGGIEPGETPAQALIRELREETGFELGKVPQPVGAGREPYPDAGIELSHTFYLIRSDRFLADPAELEDREAEWFLKFGWWPLDGLPPALLPANLGERVRALLDGAKGPLEFG